MPNNLEINNLPNNIPIFPLTGVTLLPEIELPLNIFEERYINLLDDALANKKMLGLIQPKQGIFSKIRKTKPLYKTGCLGKIKAFNETGGGQYLIVINGICRFDIEEEIPTMRGYRRFKVNYNNYADDLNTTKNREIFGKQINKKDLVEKIDEYLSQFDSQGKSITTNNSFDNMNSAFIIDFISSYMPFSPQEKQLFLECKTIEERTKALYKILGIKDLGKQLENPSALN